jgi:protein TonB
MAPDKKRPNWLLHGFIVLSLGVHILVFLHISGIYTTSAVAYIELSLDQISNPRVRSLPTPRVREKTPDVTREKMVQVKRFHVPRIRIETAVDPENNDPENRDETPLPQLPEDMDVGGFAVAGLQVQNPAPQVLPLEEQFEFTTAREYFEMLNLRIHSFKEYPESAKSRHLEGRVKVQFVVSEDGSLADIKVLKSSRYKNLDEAAVAAVKRASPFPRPPAFLFRTPLTMQISILFELA